MAEQRTIRDMTGTGAGRLKRRRRLVGAAAVVALGLTAMFCFLSRLDLGLLASLGLLWVGFDALIVTLLLWASPGAPWADGTAG